MRIAVTVLLWLELLRTWNTCFRYSLQALLGVVPEGAPEGAPLEWRQRDSEGSRGSHG
jgi:hypothetical protein